MVMNVLFVLGILAVVVVSYLVSGLIAVILMDKIGYDLSIGASVLHARNCGASSFRYDEVIAMQCVAINIQVRVILTLATYVFLVIITFAIGSGINSVIASTICMAVIIGALLNCLFAIIGEYSCIPCIARFDGVDYGEKAIRMRKLLLDDGEKADDAEFTLGLDVCEDIEDFLSRGEIVILLIPNNDSSDMVFDRLP